jgi:hypothetical protein
MSNEEFKINHADHKSVGGNHRVRAMVTRGRTLRAWKTYKKSAPCRRRPSRNANGLSCRLEAEGRPEGHV